jgi:hypothetical protein
VRGVGGGARSEPDGRSRSWCSGGDVASIGVIIANSVSLDDLDMRLRRAPNAELKVRPLVGDDGIVYCSLLSPGESSVQSSSYSASEPTLRPMSSNSESSGDGVKSTGLRSESEKASSIEAAYWLVGQSPGVDTIWSLELAGCAFMGMGGVGGPFLCALHQHGLAWPKSKNSASSSLNFSCSLLLTRLCFNTRDDDAAFTGLIFGCVRCLRVGTAGMIGFEKVGPRFTVACRLTGGMMACEPGSVSVENGEVGDETWGLAIEIHL